MKTIVVGYDEGEPAKRALARAAELAKAFGGKVLVASVARALVPAGHGLGPVGPVELHDAQVKHALAFLSGHGVQAEAWTALASAPPSSGRLTATS